MIKYDELFQMYQAGQREQLLEALLPRLSWWAKRVLIHTPQEGNRCWRAELVSAGTVKLIEALDERLASRRMESGKHLVYSLRMAVRKEMRAARRGLFVIPITPGETSKDQGVQVSLQGDFECGGMKTGRYEPAADQDFFYRDPSREDRRSRFFDLFHQAVSAAADGPDRVLVERIYSHGESVSEAARKIGMARETARDRLRRLGRRIVAKASLELHDLAEEFSQNLWNSAAETASGGHRLSRGPSTHRQPPRPTGIPSRFGSRQANFGAPAHRNKGESMAPWTIMPHKGVSGRSRNPRRPNGHKWVSPAPSKSTPAGPRRHSQSGHLSADAKR